MSALDPVSAFTAWLNKLKFEKANNGPARGTVAGALVILDRLRTEPSLAVSDNVAPKGTQIKGASGPRIASILATLGENRTYLSEGGRTNRGLLDDMAAMLKTLANTTFATASADQRLIHIDAMQALLLAKVHAYLNLQRLSVVYNSGSTTLAIITTFLQAAREAAKEGPVAQHLIGAKLQLRYPDLTIENHGATTADQQLGRPGDFIVNDTFFHVTVAPMPAVLDKCRANLASGLRAYLLVPQRVLIAAQQMAGDPGETRISVCSVEKFVSQNIDELARFSNAAHAGEVTRLFEIYNARVDAAELDKSLMASLPKNLRA